MVKEKDPEDIYRKNLDMCITDGIVKGGGGLLLGTLASVLIFKRRWPITTGLGIGMGISFANCHLKMKNSKAINKIKANLVNRKPLALYHETRTS
ncbi:hypothetical protein HW555_011843 [Spodoptera exigua]|uniref:MICOS complex subunit MIC10 n=1 Tax=Spodoptera exigua TaxID=7107 RepID=A0A835G4K6_SPOEX|nr:hypothetical protein HW555_011843 [Spodoptera exigua]